MSRTRPARRSVCPIACTLDLIGDKWTLLVIRDLMVGKTRFKDFTGSPEGIATNILTSRLDRLVEHGLVERRESERAGQWSYHLTAKGDTLEPVVLAVTQWGLEQLDGTEIRVRPTDPNT